MSLQRKGTEPAKITDSGYDSGGEKYTSKIDEASPKLTNRPFGAYNDMRHNWKEPAEAFCREKGVEKIVYQNKRHLYDLSGLHDDVVVGLFDEDGFLITRIGDLTRDWGLGYFPSGIKGLDGYFSKKQFEAANPKDNS